MQLHSPTMLKLKRSRCVFLRVRPFRAHTLFCEVRVWTQIVPAVRIMGEVGCIAARLRPLQHKSALPVYFNFEEAGK